MRPRIGGASPVLGVSVMQTEVSYSCEACGEEIVIPCDLSAGHHQDYVEDCPVCCHPNVIRLDIDRWGNVQAQSASESDLSELEDFDD